MTKPIISTESRCVAGESLRGGSERPLFEVVRVKPGLQWRAHDVGGAKAVGYLLTMAVYEEWNQPKREKCAAASEPRG